MPGSFLQSNKKPAMGIQRIIKNGRDNYREGKEYYPKNYTVLIIIRKVSHLHRWP